GAFEGAVNDLDRQPLEIVDNAGHSNVHLDGGRFGLLIHRLQVGPLTLPAVPAVIEAGATRDVSMLEGALRATPPPRNNPNYAMGANLGIYCREYFSFVDREALARASSEFPPSVQ